MKKIDNNSYIKNEKGDIEIFDQIKEKILFNSSTNKVMKVLKNNVMFGNINFIKYIFDSSISEKLIQPSYVDYVLIYACIYGKLDIIEFLFSHKKISEVIDINAGLQQPIRWSCEQGHLNIVKYLLTSPELKTHANIYLAKDEYNAFARAYHRNHEDILNYLVFDYKIKETINTMAYINNNINKDKFNVLGMFKVRELHEKDRIHLRNKV